MARAPVTPNDFFCKTLKMGRKRARFLCHVAILVTFIGCGSTEDLDFREIGGLSVASEPTISTSFRQSRRYRPQNDRQDEHENYEEENHDHRDTENGGMKAIGQAKVDYWAGYYDFLINEGSYKFWAVFQLATAALLIYSGFAALYYAKINPPTSDDEFDDIFRRRRRRRRRRSTATSTIEKPYSGFDSVTFQRILDAIERDLN